MITDQDDDFAVKTVGHVEALLSSVFGKKKRASRIVFPAALIVVKDIGVPAGIVFHTVYQSLVGSTD